MRSVLSAFYSHPWAWNEIGFGGPAYPRGYARLGAGQREELGGSAGVRARPGQGHPRTRGGGGGVRAPSRHGLRTLARGALRPPDNDSAFLLDVHRRAVPRERMARYDDDYAVDLVIVGAGAGGGTLAQRLARRGWKVVVLESGPFWDPDEDWVSDEAGSHKLYWTDERVTGGEDPVELGKNNSGHGVGGSMVHYAGYCPRFHPSDFEVRTRDGVGEDWPISYWDLKPHYERLELELPVAGDYWPWGDPHRYPHTAHPIAGGAEMAVAGAREARDRDARRAGGDHQRRVRQPAALHLPRLLPAGLQGQRQGLAARHPHPRRDRARRRDPGALHGHPGRGRRLERPGHRRALHPRRAGARAARRRGGGRRLLDRDAAAAVELDQPPLPARPGQRQRSGGPLRDGPGRAAGGRRGSPTRCGCTRRRRPRSAPSSSTRPTLRAGIRARLRDPDRRPAARSSGPST